MPRKTREPEPPQPDAEVWYAIRSSVNSLYEEMDKLEKKAPSSPLSELATNRVNRAIRQAKGLMAEFDPYMAELDEFVPAGENPEVRDAVLILGEIKAGLNRLGSVYRLSAQIGHRT
jgi:hypothetical protein